MLIFHTYLYVFITIIFVCIHNHRGNDTHTHLENTTPAHYITWSCPVWYHGKLSMIYDVHYHIVPLGIWEEFYKCNFQTHFTNWLLKYFQLIIGPRGVPQNPIDDKSTLVEVMTCCRHAINHCLALCYTSEIWYVISNYIHYKVWGEITYPFQVWEWICNFIPHFTGHVITYPCWD